MLERLRGMRAYLAGPIDRCPDEGKTWRQELTPWLQSLGIIVIDPLNKPVDIGLEEDDNRAEISRLKKCGMYDEVSKIVKIIRRVDLRFCDSADFLIVNLDLNVYPAGTCEEIAIANLQKKPIIVHCPQGKDNIPSWYFGQLVHEMFFSTWEEVKEYLIHVNCNKDVNDYKRWCFINLLDQMRKITTK